MARIQSLGVAAVLALVATVWFAAFTVDERERAILFQLGEIVRTDFSPGLHFKIPVVQNVRKFDARIQTLDAKPERFLTVEKKNVIVDAFVKWRIRDVGRYYTAVAGDAFQAGLRLDQLIKDGLRSEFSKRTIQEVVSGERAQVMSIITENANREAAKMGIEIVDVRIKRVDLPPEVSSSVFRRMESERARVAREFRSRGAEAAERIRADADRQRTIILAEAFRDAEAIRGEGDAEAARIYAEAFGEDPEFYALYRSLAAYRRIFRDERDVLVLKPDSDFFRYFGDSLGGAGGR
ncbi:protease modulator HflC [Inmirania thermothiophila]|uniref:Protein HflC n=1 Tax=Inmirania thermothiophila TaxID=1750597 RepID=A0A3N1Y383_9GAMM|nr:protease modulator HflC [Inmirania thermothiophila]ROR32032.1 protease FtsH subunit HflC [Inmirania thermothiophila]